ncbi:unnamed protein product, partial [Prorocentrum cordatum]
RRPVRGRRAPHRPGGRRLSGGRAAAPGEEGPGHPRRARRVERGRVGLPAARRDAAPLHRQLRERPRGDHHRDGAAGAGGPGAEERGRGQARGRRRNSTNGNIYALQLPRGLAAGRYAIRETPRLAGHGRYDAPLVFGLNRKGAPGYLHCALPWGEPRRRNGSAAAATLLLGAAPEASGGLRRALLGYVQRERPRAAAPLLHYNSWYDMGTGEPFGEREALDAIAAVGEALASRGSRVDAYLFDDGWDDPDGPLWGFNANFSGPGALRRAAERHGSELGFWLSPQGGYHGPAQARLRAARRDGILGPNETFTLTHAGYFERVVATVTRFGILCSSCPAVAASAGQWGAPSTKKRTTPPHLRRAVLDVCDPASLSFVRCFLADDVMMATCWAVEVSHDFDVPVGATSLSTRSGAPEEWRVKVMGERVQTEAGGLPKLPERVPGWPGGVALCLGSRVMPTLKGINTALQSSASFSERQLEPGCGFGGACGRAECAAAGGASLTQARQGLFQGRERPALQSRGKARALSGSSACLSGRLSRAWADRVRVALGSPPPAPAGAGAPPGLRRHRGEGQGGALALGQRERALRGERCPPGGGGGRPRIPGGTGRRGRRQLPAEVPAAVLRAEERQRWTCKSCLRERAGKAWINSADRSSCFLCGIHRSACFGGHLEPSLPSKRGEDAKGGAPPKAATGLNPWSKETKELEMLRRKVEQLAAAQELYKEFVAVAKHNWPAWLACKQELEVERDWSQEKQLLKSKEALDQQRVQLADLLKQIGEAESGIQQQELAIKDLAQQRSVLA